MSTAETKLLIEEAVRNFQREVPALQQLKLVVELELRGRGDIQLFRVAMELIVTGRVIDAHEAQRIGLVNEVVPRGTCRERARELAHAIAALPQPAIRTDHEAAVRGFGRPLDEGLRIEAECFNRLIGGPEMAEGLRRFNERDHPDRERGGTPATPGLARPRTD